jgi:hypothetical protein
MPATPISGPISFSNIINLAKDYPGYIPPANIGLQALTLHVRTYGQSIPPNYPNNIAFSDFRLSTIVNWSVSMTNETPSTYGNNDNGTISVLLNLSTFKADAAGIRRIELSLPGQEDPIQTITTTASGSQTLIFNGMPSGSYIVNALDLVTNVTTTKSITVGYG